MALLSSSQAEAEAVLTAARLIMAALTTAPKGRGVSTVSSVTLTDPEKETLAQAMEAHFRRKRSNLEIFLRDAGNIRAASAVLLIGVRGTAPKKPEKPLDCGACGLPGCAEFLRVKKGPGEDFTGPLCAFQVMDLGIALGVAAKMAAELNIDNRLMYTAGAAARTLGLLEADLMIALPLSVTPKNPFFDRV
ncbi:MAG: hypothetical protein HY697_02120 [Deltaproteobacteria bacterium]|nr:hypothetical protein [Deltaproteobacteria bacterium]